MSNFQKQKLMNQMKGIERKAVNKIKHRLMFGGKLDSNEIEIAKILLKKAVIGTRQVRNSMLWKEVV